VQKLININLYLKLLLVFHQHSKLYEVDQQAEPNPWLNRVGYDKHLGPLFGTLLFCSRFCLPPPPFLLCRGFTCCPSWLVQHINSGVLKGQPIDYQYTNVLVHKRTSTQMCWYTNVPVHKCTGTQRYRYTNVPVHNCTGTQSYLYTNVPVHK
jgi:hypothetical protein